MLLPPPPPQIGNCRFDPLSRLGLAAPRSSPAELWEAHSKLVQRIRKLVSDDQVRAARAAIEAARKEWAVMGGEAAHDGDRWDLHASWLADRCRSA